MEYFVNHVGYALLIGLFIAVLGLLTAYFAWRSQKLNEEHGYDPAWDKSEFACPGCKFVGVCQGMAQLKHQMDEEKADGKTDSKNAESGCGFDPIVKSEENGTVDSSPARNAEN
ncbi:MAG: hypothetical protein PUC44_00180 [Eubacteriales bacterium]|nr:hypothetical protein [Eubacteriales bacterium]